MYLPYVCTKTRQLRQVHPEQLTNQPTHHRSLVQSRYHRLPLHQTLLINNNHSPPYTPPLHKVFIKKDHRHPLAKHSRTKTNPTGKTVPVIQAATVPPTALAVPSSHSPQHPFNPPLPTSPPSPPPFSPPPSLPLPIIPGNRSTSSSLRTGMGTISTNFFGWEVVMCDVSTISKDIGERGDSGVFVPDVVVVVLVAGRFCVHGKQRRGPSGGGCDELRMCDGFFWVVRRARSSAEIARRWSGDDDGDGSAGMERNSEFGRGRRWEGEGEGMRCLSYPQRSESRDLRSRKRTSRRGGSWWCRAWWWWVGSGLWMVACVWSGRLKVEIGRDWDARAWDREGDADGDGEPLRGRKKAE
ncbi:hypothetical protein QBC47DRAFT_387046 [Echria macrotheca]|uniref:Uncharacterized protein n=1 Tax=Echria macrotheca TaxID=438768 RepID=A0AAJ0BDA4_9PEZI|nr:hypothetical protein QBC47DRAFT_387046 [Echria macrotheca]